MGSNSGPYTLAYTWFPTLLTLGSGVFGFLISSRSHLTNPDLARDLTTSQLNICGMLRLFVIPSKTPADGYLMDWYFSTPFFPMGPNLPVWMHSFFLCTPSPMQVDSYTLSSDIAFSSLVVMENFWRWGCRYFSLNWVPQSLRDNSLGADIFDSAERIK